jgi:hypothetical protein
LNQWPYNPITTAAPPWDAPLPSKIMHDLAAILTTELASKGVRVFSEMQLPGGVTLMGLGDVVLLLTEAGFRNMDAGGMAGTLGIRVTKVLTIGLHAIIGTAQTSLAQVALVAQDLPLEIERAVKRNLYLPDPGTARNQLQCGLQFADGGLLNSFAYGFIDGKAALWRSREMTITAARLLYWMQTPGATVGGS